MEGVEAKGVVEDSAKEEGELSDDDGDSMEIEKETSLRSNRSSHDVRFRATGDSTKSRNETNNRNRFQSNVYEDRNRSRVFPLSRMKPEWNYNQGQQAPLRYDRIRAHPQKPPPPPMPMVMQRFPHHGFRPTTENPRIPPLHPFEPWQEFRNRPDTNRIGFWEKTKLRSQKESTNSKRDKDEQENDYEGLLKTYKNIQEQLAVLGTEEAKVKRQLSGEDNYDNREGSIVKSSPSAAADCAPPPEVTKRNEAPVVKPKEEVTPSQDSKNQDDDTTQKDVKDIGTQKAQTDNKSGGEEDDDMYLLELRRIALASAMNSKEKSPGTSQGTAGSTPGKSKILPKEGRKTGGRTDRQNSKSVKRQSSRSDNRYDSRQRNLRPVNRQSQGQSRRLRQSGNRSRYRHEDNDRRRKEEERHRQQEEKRHADEMQRREIQKILTLDDPEEQVGRFLKLLNLKNKSPLGERRELTRRGSKSPVPRGQRTLRGLQQAHGKTPNLQDNYEEVEMDLDSDTGSPAISLEGTSGFEDLGFEIDYPQGFFHPVPPMSLNVHSPSGLTAMWDQKLESTSWLDVHSDLVVPDSEVSPLPLVLPPPPPPPLPPEEPRPPPPPPESPPPLPSEPPPVEDTIPPPPPPPPEEECPAHSKENEEDEDEDEEAVLRAQLLKSLAAKKKKQEEVEKLKEEEKSAESTPVSSRGQSPIPTLVQRKNQDRGKPLTQMKIPIQKPLVINLGEDTSEEEEEEETKLVTQSSSSSLLSGLDFFLKEAKKSSEDMEKKPEKIDDDLARKLKVQECEDKFLKQRADIMQDQQKFKVLLSRASKYKKSMDRAQEQVEKFREQLAAAVKIASATKEQFEKIRKVARVLRDRIRSKTEDLKELEKTTIEAGKSLYGENYKPRTASREVTLPVGKGIQNFSVTVVNEISSKMKSRGKENNPNNSQRASDIFTEKERLQKLAEEYAKKIQELKMTQAKKVKMKMKNNLKKSGKVPIPRLEKIEIDTTESIDSGDEKPSKRRRSLLDMNPSNKPNIVCSKNEAKSVITETKSSAAGVEKLISDFHVPNIQQLNKLTILLKENINKCLSNSDTISWYTPNLDYQDGCLLPRCQEIPSLIQHRKAKRPSSDSNNHHMYPALVYKSALLHFRSYRFSPYYRTKQNLTLSSHTFTSKLNPNKTLCKFDLLGTCNDDDCEGQHKRNYEMSEAEILQDIVSYHPALCGISRETPVNNYPKIISAYVGKLMKKHEGKITTDELKILLLSQVLEKTGHKRPHTTYFPARRWRLQFDPTKKNEKEDLSVKGEDRIDWLKPEPSQNKDNVIGEQDVRYFLVDSSSVQEMESAVIEEPNNIAMWLKLTYKKLHDTDNKSPIVCLDHALNVLARGLEQNKSNSDLWQQYLHLYSKHLDASDLSSLCETALQMTQTYEIWWQYIKSKESCLQRITICDSVMEFLRSQNSMEQEVRSHQCLEIVLYKTSLYLWSGRQRSALKFLKSILQSDSTTYDWLQKELDISDRCVLWLSYIHIMEFKQLPPQLYDPANQQSGKIVNKENIDIQWPQKSELSNPIETLLEMFWEAVDVCIGPLNTGNPNLISGLQLYKNHFNLLKTKQRYNEAASLCRQLLLIDPTMIDIWLCVAELYSICGDASATRQVFNDGLDAIRCSAQLYFYAANFELQQEEPNKALELLEYSAVSYFDVDIKNSKQADPNMLFCMLLGEAVPLNFTAPPYQTGVTQQHIQADHLYIWLNYSLLLELQGDCAQTVEVYETALSNFVKVEDVAKIWSSYLSYQIRQIQPNTTNPAAAKKYLDLMNRCIGSVPTKFEIPHCPGKYWRNYYHINMLIERFIDCVPKDDQFGELQRMSEIMPLNVNLLFRVCHVAVTMEDYTQARCLCTTAVHEGVANIYFWKMVTALSLKLQNMKEVRKLYHKAVQRLPYAATLWKDFLLFEVIERSTSIIPQMLSRCQDLGVNVQDYFDFIINYSKFS